MRYVTMDNIDPDLHEEKEKQQIELLLEFMSYTKNYCVCIVDMVGSTKIVKSLDNTKVSKYYSIFLNGMAYIAKNFDAIVVKNVGDSLLFYFPDPLSDNLEYFKNVFRCCLTMIDKHEEINILMGREGLPEVNYRISSEYGPVVFAKISTSSVNDIFGSTVNICSKINTLAKPNSFAIGQELYNRTSSLTEYTFTKIDSEDYVAYLVTR